MIRVAHVAQVSDDCVSGVDKMVVGVATHPSDPNVVSEVWHLEPSISSVTDRSLGSVRVFCLPARAGRLAAMTTSCMAPARDRIAINFRVQSDAATEGKTG